MVQLSKKGTLPPGEDIPPSPMEVMFENMNSGSMKAEVMRKLPDGSLESASAKQLGGLSTKSRVAYATQNLKQLKPEERLAWAMEMKEYANELYANNEIQSAMEKYVEALSASDFGKKAVDRAEDEDASSDAPVADGDASVSLEGNVDTLVIPCLTNLAACCIQIRDFPKALKFADSALELRPKCGKALMRRGMSLVYIGEYDTGITALEACAAITIDENSTAAAGDEQVKTTDPKIRSSMPISDSDRVRVPILIDRAERGKERDARNEEKQRAKMRRVFGKKGSGGGDGGGRVSKDPRADPTRLEEGKGRKQVRKRRGSDAGDDDDDEGLFAWWIPFAIVLALGLMGVYQLRAERFAQHEGQEREGELG